MPVCVHQMIYNIRTAIPMLKKGRTVKVRDYGDSMEPLIHSGEIVTVAPFDDGVLNKGDVVLAKVRGRLYLHKVTGFRRGLSRGWFHRLVQISNNRGKVNGWTTARDIYGKVISIGS